MSVKNVWKTKKQLQDEIERFIDYNTAQKFRERAIAVRRTQSGFVTTKVPPSCNF